MYLVKTQRHRPRVSASRHAPVLTSLSGLLSLSRQFSLTDSYPISMLSLLVSIQPTGTTSEPYQLSRSFSVFGPQSTVLRDFESLRKVSISVSHSQFQLCSPTLDDDDSSTIDICVYGIDTDISSTQTLGPVTAANIIATTHGADTCCC